MQSFSLYLFIIIDIRHYSHDALHTVIISISKFIKLSVQHSVKEHNIGKQNQDQKQILDHAKYINLSSLHHWGLMSAATNFARIQYKLDCCQDLLWTATLFLLVTLEWKPAQTTLVNKKTNSMVLI